MYRVELSGCLTLLLSFLLLIFILKELWWLIVGIAIIAVVIYYMNLIYKLLVNKNNESELNYTPKMGEVYKVCPYCNTKVRVTAVQCPVCKRALN